MNTMRRVKMYLVFGIVLSVILMIIFLKLPFSFVKKNCMKTVNRLIDKASHEDELFTEDELRDLPRPLQQYFKYCGYIGTKKMSYMKAEFKNVTFRQGTGSHALTIDYTQYNFVDQPDRIALISSSLYGIPFEGCDSYVGGLGRMKGVIGKLITIFNVTGDEMDKACLVTFLADSMIMPNSFLKDYIKWEEVDTNHVKAQISYYGTTAVGIFTINDIGEITSFITNDRAVYNSYGTMSYEKWTITCEDYSVNTDGIKHPMKMKAIWNYKNGDFIYFDSNNLKVEYY